MLEQVSNIEAVKKAPFSVDSPKSGAKPAAKSGAPESTPDFKSVLEQSLRAAQEPSIAPNASHAQGSKNATKGQASGKSPNQAAQPNLAQSSPALSPKLASSTNAAKSGDLALGAGGAPKPKGTDELANLLQGKAAESSTPANAGASGVAGAIGAGAAGAAKKKTLNDMAKQEPQETFLSKITQNKLDAAQSSSSPANSSSLTGAESSTPSPAQISAKSPATAKSSAPESTSLSGAPNAQSPESTQGAGASKALASKTPSTNAGDSGKALGNAQAGDAQASAAAALAGLGGAQIAQALTGELAGELAGGLVGELAQGAQAPQSPSAKGAPNSAAGAKSPAELGAAKASAQDSGMGAKGESKLAATVAGAKTLGDVVNKAQDLGLNPSKAEFSQDSGGDEEFINSLTARTGMRQAPTSSDGIKQFFDKQDELALRPFFSMLGSVNAMEAALRRRNKNANKIEYVLENKTEKIAIINRGKTLPKNITESRLRNERQEKVFEQIQKDIIAGRELDLEQIKAELFASGKDTDALASPLPKPALARQALGASAGATATIAAQAGAAALVQEAKGQGNARKDSRKDSQSSARENLKESLKESAKGEPANATKLAQDLEPTKAGQNLELAGLGLDEQDFAPQEQMEQMLEKSTTAPKPSESAPKPEAKPESKLAAAGAGLGASALKGESKPMAREAIASFVSQFDQEIKKFKPPMNRLSMELSPKELGNIELTITQRGNNLHISVVSNPQALNLFAQNQLELRQNLIAQGFEGVDLSFTDSSGGSFGGGSGENGRGDSGGDRRALDSGLDSGADELAQAPAQMNITLPLYA